MIVALTRDELLDLLASKAMHLLGDLNGRDISDQDLDIQVSRLSALVAALFQAQPTVGVTQ